MSNVITIKKSKGSSAPSSLKMGELAYAEGGNTLYIGGQNKVKAIAGDGYVNPVVATEDYVDDKYGQNRYTHTQSTSANPWPITHNLGYYPDVTIMQPVSGGGSDDYEEVEAHIQHNSVNDLTINLSGVATGLALMR